MIKYLTIIILGLLLPIKVLAAINVLVAAPQSGVYRQFGQELAEGVKIAAQDINNRGGLLGQKINVIIADDRCNDVFAVSMAQMLGVNINKDDRLNLIIGPFCMNKISEVADIYAKSQINQIIPMPINDDLQNFNGAYPLQIAGSQSNQAKVFYEYYRKNLQGKKVALVYDSNKSQTVWLSRQMQKEFANDKNLKMVDLYDVATYGNDLAQATKEIISKNEAVYLNLSAKKTAKLTRKIKEQNSKIAVFTDLYKVNDDYKRIIGGYVDGNYYLGLKDFKDRTYFTEILVKLRLQGLEPVGLGVYGFASLNLWAQIADRAQSLNYINWQQKAQKERFMMPWGEVSFGSKAEIINKDNAMVYGIFVNRGGEYTQVY